MTSIRDNAEHHRYELDAPEGVTIAVYRDVGSARACGGGLGLCTPGTETCEALA